MNNFIAEVSSILVGSCLMLIYLYALAWVLMWTFHYTAAYLPMP